MDANTVCLPVRFVHEIAATRSATEIPQVVARWIRTIFQADRASITLADGTTHLKLIALEGNEALPIDMRVPIEGTMVGRVFVSRQAEFCNDLAHAQDFDCRILAEHGILSCLDAPLAIGEHCLGTLNVGRSRLEAFCWRETEELEAMARLIATLMHVHRQADQLREAADRDPLTGALNRRAFSKFLDVREGSVETKGLGVALIDLDHFKSINDNFGHEVGDRVLVHVSELLHMTCREQDLVARFGGEEFFIAANEIDAASFRALLNRLLRTLRSTPVLTAQGPVSVTASVGAICVVGCSRTFDDLYARVDKALYEAKKLGRDRVVFADSAA
ncbi:sensor domain-containing diguanylate cyclase [Kaistia adipata]|uniref:sensor domain-containing diguanylate cyclase n=1 Tax=Kaistia adipata TaxID=166954 RepID=UPI0004046037|nr:sensor domain-containing diguanylate cyclase [Kaistia adipata]